MSASGQIIKQIPLNKPVNFKDKILRSEKTEDVSLTLPRRLYHGMVSHYNYYYNAQVKLDAIVQKAQLAHKEDFTKLLPFYDYSVNVTSADSVEIDSVMIKATAGIVLHDLRNSYIDDLLLLIGKSYYYWNKPDSSYRIFQYINYNFYPNKKDEFRIAIGSAGDAKDGKLTIGTKEKKGIITKTFSKPPARNEALLWMAKIYAEQDLHDEAVSLIYILKKDPNFPKRLHPHLDEIMAYSFYNRETWDSAAFYLQKSLKTAETTAQLARKEFLLGQLFTLANKTVEASSFYQKAKTHTNDPVMHIHARLKNVLLTNTDSSNINQSLNDLLKLAKKERFDGYEDLLYYAASDVALQKKDTPLAYSLLQKSVRFAQKNPESTVKNNAFSKLGGVALKQKNYRLAASCYDSINLQDPNLQNKLIEIEKTKKFLTELVQQKDIVIKEDSLQKIAAMPEEEREAYLKTLLKRLRKEKGLKEDVPYTSSVNNSLGTSSGNQSQDLFATGNNAGWYFNANNQKNKGPAEFKNKWGNRPNQDNWRRQSAIDASIANSNLGMFGNPGGDGDIDNPRPINPVLPSGESDQDLSIESLRYNLPLTDEKTASSNQLIYDALLSQGNILKNQLEDYEGAAQVYMELLKRFPQKDSTSQVLSELYYCLLKTGDQKTADLYRQSLEKAGLNDQKIKFIDTSKTATLNKEVKAIATYEQIYRWYIEGEFSKARQNKITADSIYGNHFWTPQLIYIEAVYFVHIQQDSAALLLLNDLLTRFGSNPVAEKAVILKDVLQRRAEIEQHLRESKVVREEEPKIVPAKKPENVNITKTEPVLNTTTTKQSGNNTDAGNTDKQNIKTSLPDSSKTAIVTVPDKKTDPNQSKNQADTIISPPLHTNVIDKPIENKDSCTLVVALINVYPVYKTECQTTIETYLRSNSLSGETGITSSLIDGKGNYGWITINHPYSAADCEKVRHEFKTILPKQLYFMPADKYKLLALNSSQLKQLELTENIDDFIKIISQWIKD